MKTLRRALVSVSDKTGLGEFAAGLVELGFEILSTGGTRKALATAGVPVMDISEYTGFPEVMDGRVKTLHPKVHGAILGRPDLPGDAEAIAAHNITPFELVICNLYPFQQTIAKPGVTTAEAIEQIDIGGPSMIRSAAKNHAYVGVVSSPDQYAEVLAALKAGPLPKALRTRLAAAAFEMTAVYDRGIADYMSGLPDVAGEDSVKFPQQLTLSYQQQSALRYGENPHQLAAFYVEPNAGPATIAAAKQLNGKELSYNNLLDVDAAWNIAADFADPVAVVIKHNNPCGCAIGDDAGDAIVRAWAGDPVSAFGSILSFNRPLNAAAAEFLCSDGRFVEAIIAPAFDDEAFEILTTRPKWKNNVRLLTCELPSEQSSTHTRDWDLRKVSGGLLVQQRDTEPDPQEEWKIVTEQAPSDEQLVNLKFAWTVCKHVKSNAIVFVNERAVVGVGAGQMSRLDSSFIAAHKSSDRSQGGVLASDAFFPFRDGVDQAAAAGIKAVIQPGGSRNDDQVIAACNEHNIAMLFTGRRHFKH